MSLYKNLTHIRLNVNSRSCLTVGNPTKMRMILSMTRWWKSSKAVKGSSTSRALTSGSLVSFLFHLPNFARLYWSLFWDKRAPVLPKIALALAIIYFVSPFDLLPDFAIPGLGYIDDLAILALALRYFIKAMPKDLVAAKVDAIDKRPGS